jgi:L-ascorbate metabolism protein UlaG (beta-lactamase superfamily)
MARRFTNPDPADRPHGFGTTFRWGVWDRLTGRRRIAPPGPPAPRVAPDLARVQAPAEEPRLTWIGHSSFLVSLAGRHVLVDPVFGRWIGPAPTRRISFPRHGEPGLLPSQLPPLAAVLISHNHYDHLDLPSLRALPAAVPLLVPLGLGRWFRRHGFPAVRELGWWDEIDIGPLAVTFVPARHWSRRTFWDTNRSWWGGFVIAAGGRAVYHAGDSATFPGFAEIGRRFPRLDAALLPIGGYEPRWFMASAHMDPDEAGRAFLATGARCLVPLHWGAFQLTDEPLAEPAARLRAWWERDGPRDGRVLRVMAVGETVELATRATISPEVRP